MGTKRAPRKQAGKHKDPAERVLIDGDDALPALQAVIAAGVRSHPDAAPLRDGEPISPDDQQAADDATHIAIELLGLAANLTERRLTAEDAATARAEIYAAWAAMNSLEPTSERQARGALVDLIEGAAEMNEACGVRELDEAAIETTLLESADWVIECLGQTFPKYAEKLRTAKREELAKAIAAFWIVGLKTESGVPIGAGESKWEALESMGKGVFFANRAKDWKDNHRRWRKGELSLSRPRSAE